MLHNIRAEKNWRNVGNLCEEISERENRKKSSQAIVEVGLDQDGLGSLSVAIVRGTSGIMRLLGGLRHELFHKAFCW